MRSNAPSRSTLVRWGIKGGWSILDQGTYSGANFLLNILLARWLSPDVYGGYSVAFSFFLLLSNAQVALIAEPMSIFGAGKYRDQQPKYLDFLLRNQWIGAVLCWLLIPLSFFLLRGPNLQLSIIAMLLALPFILGYWYMRRAYYLEARADLALASSIVYAVILLLFILIFRNAGVLSVPLAFLAMAIASVVASMTTIKPLHIRYFGGYTETPDVNKNQFSEVWDFGKWILVASVASWLTTMAYPSVIGFVLGLEQAGAFRAVQVLFLPLQQLLAAITLLILPWLSKQRSSHGDKYLMRFTLPVVGVVCIFSLLYCFLVAYFGEDLIYLLYKNAFYGEYSYLIVYLALASLLGVIPLVLGLTLRVLNRPKDILYSRGIAALFVVTVGFACIYIFRFQGVILSLVLGAGIEAIILVLIYYNVWKKLRV
jgi:O-antigen/teichoic acid export membrane protein